MTQYKLAVDGNVVDTLTDKRPDTDYLRRLITLACVNTKGEVPAKLLRSMADNKLAGVDDEQLVLVHGASWLNLNS
jgi:hypothetical protein